jgi:hypothetical protein
LKLKVSCFEIEGSALRLAAFTLLPLKAVVVAEVDGFGSGEKRVGKSKCGTAD